MDRCMVSPWFRITQVYNDYPTTTTAAGGELRGMHVL